MPDDRAGRSLIVNILEILKRYSDEDHPLTQSKIMDILKKEYGVSPDRKTLRRNLEQLIYDRDDIEYTEKERKGGEPVKTNIYLSREFSGFELSLLINSVMCSPYIKHDDAADLAERLRGLASVHFKDKTAKMKAVTSAPDLSQEYFLSIDALHQAIQEEKQVTFNYCHYEPDMKLHPKMRDGKPQLYTVNPYRVVDVNGRTYLICNTGGKEGVSNYRVDKMRDVAVAETPARPAREMADLVSGLLDLPGYLAEHLNMSFRKSEYVTMRFETGFANVVIDTFGQQLRILKTDGEYTTAQVKVDTSAIETWALQYPEKLRILEPPELAETIRQRFIKGAEMYK